MTNYVLDTFTSNQNKLKKNIKTYKHDLVAEDFISKSNQDLSEQMEF